MPITLLKELPEVRFGHWGPVFVSVWFSELTERSLDALESHQRDLAKRYPSVTLLSVVVGASKAPPPELRDRIKAQSNELRKQRIGNIVAVTNKGVGAIIARTFLAALSLISDEKMIIVKTAREAAEAARAIPGQAGEVIAHASLGEELEAFVAQAAPQAASSS
ncbi:MAG: hypothetical protein JST54_34370 [Deltaproteobacteria bacterium]|nr:hypothetical protein [Deltaproteobacteria bacterium]